MFAYCLNNPVNGCDLSGKKKWFIDPDGNPQEENAVIYQVPLLNQGELPLCWAYCILMNKCYHAGKLLTEDEQKEYIKTWGLAYQFLYNNEIALPYALQGRRASMNSIEDLYKIVLVNGPVYAAYDIPWTTKGHIVLVTGVDIEKDIIYTNNPWGVKGQQSFQEFCDGFDSGDNYEDPRFTLYGIYVPTF